MPTANEADLEAALLEVLSAQGIPHLPKEVTAPGDPGGGALRSTWGEVVLLPRLRSAVSVINPHLPLEAREMAVRAITDRGVPETIQENRRIHELLVGGVAVEWAEGGGTRYGRAALVDWDNGLNDWAAASQLTVAGAHVRRTDVLLYLNGIPIVLVELKAPEAEGAGIKEAYNQLVTYRADLPELFRFLAFNVASDGWAARYGTLSADLERYMPWRTVDGDGVAPPGSIPLVTLARGLLNRTVLLAMVRRFIVFEDAGAAVIKKAAGYHQYHAAMKALASTLAATAGDRRGGVVWHTQGSGKSLLMAFFVGLLVNEGRLGNPTVLVLTDRNDLDNQLYDTFAACRRLFGQEPVQADGARKLRELLNREAGGVIFSTIQKFRPEAGRAEMDALTERRNVVVLVDEAHRSQYGFAARLSGTTGRLDYGFAHQLRRALPGATFVGFTGTPVELGDRNTPAVFGDYVDIYDIARAVEDGATVPIYYEARLARLAITDEAMRELGEGYEEATEGVEEAEEARYASRWARLEALMGASERLDMVAGDALAHFDRRQAAIAGKAMIVCMSRRICVEVYERIRALRPEWHDAEDGGGAVKVVMTGSAADPEAFQPHLRNKRGLERLAERFKDPADPLKVVIVRNMWLTGFDAPSMHTLYVDKPMHGHDLMQAIARVNRVFSGKPGGLVVDYVGIAADLKDALAHYSPGDAERTGIDRARAVRAFLERLDIVRGVLHPLDPARAAQGTPLQRMEAVGAAMERVFSLVKPSEGMDEAKARRAGRKRYMDAALALLAAFKLAAGSDEADAAKDEVAFCAAVRVAILKTEADGEGGGPRPGDVDAAVAQLINGAVASTEVVDILAACGLDSPDVSVLSEAFLEEVRGMEQKNLAVEALRRLLNGEIASRTRTNVVQQKAFTERLAEAMRRYHNRSVDALQVLRELVELARELREQPDTGLTLEETAFYDALAENRSAVEAMGNESLRTLAAALVREVRSNSGVDWWRREQARARIRVAVRRLLRTYGYPPDLQAAAIDLVVQQAEALAAEVAKAA